MNKFDEMLKRMEAINKSLDEKKIICKKCSSDNIMENDIKIICKTCHYVEKKVLKCSNCPVSEIVENSHEGIICCKLCGEVIAQLLDESPEWLKYDNTEGTSRCNGVYNHLLPISSLGNKTLYSGNSKMMNIQIWGSMDYRERSLHKEFKKITRVCLSNGIAKCIEDDAKFLYKRFNDSRYANGKKINKKIITRGNNRIGILAGCVYYSCKKKNKPYTPDEMATLFNIDNDIMNKGIKILRKHNLIKDNGITLPSQYIQRYCDKLNIITYHKEIAKRVSENVEIMELTKHNTTLPVVAACILLVANEYHIPNITIQKLSKIFSITVSTIKKTYITLEKHKGNIFGSCEKNIPKKKRDATDEIKERMVFYGIDGNKDAKINSLEDYVNLYYKNSLIL